MSSCIKNRDIRSISIGSKISILFKESETIENQPALVGIIGIDKTPENENSHFPELIDLPTSPESTCKIPNRKEPTTNSA